MNKIRDHFKHRKGKDCITASLRNLVHYLGVDLSESMVFGIGMGLRFWYSQLDDKTAFPVMIGQETDIEKIFCQNFGLNFEVQQDYTGEMIKKRLDNHLPTIVKADPYYLPYAWEGCDMEPMHFGEHVLLVVDYDETFFYISDIWHEVLTRVKHDELLAARTTREGMSYLLPHARWLKISMQKNLGFDFDSVTAILKNTCLRHLTEVKPYGVSGMRFAAEALPKYLLNIYKNQNPDLSCILQSISMRMYEGDEYTLFRGLFFGFLKEYFGTNYEKIKDLLHLEKEIINGWKKINNLFLTMLFQFENDTQTNFEINLEVLSKRLSQMALFEESLCQCLIQQLQKR